MPQTSIRDIQLPYYATRALDVLESNGFEAWCVGGCIRDCLLGRPANDYDIATSAPWPETKRVFEAAGWKTHDTGIKHGTVTVSDGEHALEVTTYRSDGAYSDGRHPDSVSFVNSIAEDIARRDFTINALAYHPDRGVLDLVGGLDDLDAGIIRAIGNAFDRFEEDALRVLRGCRFASQLGFTIEDATLAAMIKQKTLMLRVSSERITHELQEFLLGEHIHDALMQSIDVLGAILPELIAMKGFEQHTPYHIYDVLEHTAYVLQNTPPYPLVRWAALFHDIGKPGAYFNENGQGHFFGHARISVFITRATLGRLSLPPAFVDDVLTLVRIHDDVIQANPRAVKRALARLDGRVEMFEALCDLKRADALAQAPICADRVQLACDLVQTLAEVLDSHEAFARADLAIDGNDVIAAGATPGPQVGTLIAAALDAVIDGEIPNERDALLAFVGKHIAAEAD